MAIASVSSGSVLVKLPVHYTALNLAEITAEVAANPGLYNSKVLKALDTGVFHYVDADDNISTLDSRVLDRPINAEIGVVDLVANRCKYTLTADESNLDPTGSGINDCNVLVLANLSGGTKLLKGLVRPTKGKTLVVYNEGPDQITIRDNHVDALPENRFDIGTNIVLAGNEGIWVYYDIDSLRWRSIKF